MKISVNWLKDFITLDEPPAVLAASLSMLGLPVDALEAIGHDAVLEVDVTANRPDCLSHVGVARELAVSFRERLRLPEVGGLTLPGEAEAPAVITIEAPDLCARYCGMVVRGIRVAPSPDWMQERLLAVGQRPINNIVDITNYVLQEMGHPLHAFDYRKLKGGRIIVRRARLGEQIQTLDGQLRALQEEMLVIADAADPVAVAGVMGGANSEVDDTTTDILIESAWFQPVSVRKTARALGLSTEASYRFERGADPAIPIMALLRCVKLIVALAGGQPASPAIDVVAATTQHPAIHLRRDQVRLLIGAEVADDLVEDFLTRLGSEITGRTAEGWRVTPPSFRQDLTLEVDLIEEVARFYGYNRLPGTLPPLEGRPVERKYVPEREAVRQCCREMGFQEILTPSFVEAAQAESFEWAGPAAAIRIDNPLDEQQSSLRINLLSGLVTCLKHNENNFNQDILLFEIAAVYRQGEEGDRESTRLVLGVCGNTTTAHWLSPAGTPFNFYHLKGSIETCLRRLGVTGYDFVPADDLAFLQPGAAARLMLDGKVAGVCGQLGADTTEAWKFRRKVFVAELMLDVIFAASDRKFKFQPLPRFPFVARDMSFTVDNTLSYSTIKMAVEDMVIPELARFSVLDLYRGKDIPTGRKALAMRLVFQHPDRTLTDAEADALRGKVSEMLSRKFEAVFR